MRNLKKMSSDRLFKYADEMYAKTMEFVAAPSGYRLEMTPELEAFAKREGNKIRDQIRAAAIEKQAQEEAERTGKTK